MPAWAMAGLVATLTGGLLMSQCAWARDPSAAPAQVRGEIAALLSAVETGGCEFMRNGTWHTGGDARKMLDHKLSVALRDPGGVPSSEHFIQKMASHSSMSGKAYMVRCGDAKAVESGPWLMNKLAELRTAKPSPTVAAPYR